MTIKSKRNISLGMHLLMKWGPIYSSLFKRTVTCPFGSQRRVHFRQHTNVRSGGGERRPFFAKREGY